MQSSAASRTLGAILRRQADAFPDKDFLVFPNQAWTYAAFDAWVDRLARGLLGLGLNKGDKVGIMLPNCPEYVAFWFACARIGAVEVPINVSYRGHLLQHVQNQSDTRMLVIAGACLAQCRAVADACTKLEHAVVLFAKEPGAAGLPIAPLAIADLEVEGPAPVEVPVSPNDPLAIMFTSGTTGPSKGVVLTHNAFWWYGERGCELRGVTAGDRLYTCLPLAHGNAQGLTTTLALFRGATAVIDTGFTASGFWDRLRQFGATQFNYIGGIIPILMKQKESPRDRDHAVRVGFGAGAPKDDWLAFEQRFGLRLIEAYGQTEDGMVTCNKIGSGKIGSIGKPEWGYEMQVVDDDDEVVPDGTVGEFVVRPQHPNIMMLGYYKMPEATLGVFRNLWFHTGDLGSRDSDGYFYFVDRKKDAIRRRGENISAYEVELAVNSHPAVLESAAYAVASEVGEDDVMVAVVLRQGSTVTALELVQHCEKDLPYFAMPRYLDFRTEFPKTPTLRIEKYKLREQGITPTTWDVEKSGYKLRRH